MLASYPRILFASLFGLSCLLAPLAHAGIAKVPNYKAPQSTIQTVSPEDFQKNVSQMAQQNQATMQDQISKQLSTQKPQLNNSQGSTNTTAQAPTTSTTNNQPNYSVMTGEQKGSGNQNTAQPYTGYQGTGSPSSSGNAQTTGNGSASQNGSGWNIDY